MLFAGDATFIGALGAAADRGALDAALDAGTLGATLDAGALGAATDDVVVAGRGGAAADADITSPRAPRLTGAQGRAIVAARRPDRPRPIGSTARAGAADGGGGVRQ
jgi:hypothetical protein